MLTTEQKKRVANAKKEFVREYKGATITSQSVRGGVFTINYKRGDEKGSVGYYITLPESDV